jgi:ribose-phosphate pyrophosphokinase
MGTPVIIDLNQASSFEAIRYPAGETQIRFKEAIWPSIKEADEITIIARIGNAQDIVALALLNNALGTSRQYRTLVLPYLPYGRADRQFREGDCAGLMVFGQLIGSMNFDNIVTLDAHNHERAQYFVPFLTDKTASRFIERAVVNFARDHGYERKCINVVFPDEGARARYQVPDRYAGNVSHVDTETFHCSKHRDPITGSLLGFEVPEMPDRPTIIIDDICDGGGTFVGIAKQLHERPVGPRGLYVTHGIFSKGFGELNTYFDNIYTTDSIPQKGPDKLVTVYECRDELMASR